MLCVFSVRSMIWRRKRSLIFKLPRYLYLDKYERYAQNSRISQAGTRISAREHLREQTRHKQSQFIHTRLVSTKNAAAHKQENVSIHSVHVCEHCMHAYCRTHKSLVCSHRCFAQIFYYQPVIFYYYSTTISRHTHTHTHTHIILGAQ
jgi:hypothetical protein